jgi:integrase/recombinase XerC
MLVAIRAYAKWAMETEQINSDPMRGIKLLQGQKLVHKWLDRGQQDKLISAAGQVLNGAQTDTAKMLAQRDFSIIHILINTGLRIEELTSLTRADVVILPRKGKIVIRQGKGERRRKVPLNTEAWKVISDWLVFRGDKGTLLFSGKRGEGISISGVHRRLAELGRIAKIEVHAHKLRHTFSKKLIDAGVSLEKVASLL